MLFGYLIFIVTFFKDGAPIWINYRRNFLGQFAPKVIIIYILFNFVLVFCHLCRRMQVYEILPRLDLIWFFFFWFDFMLCCSLFQNLIIPKSIKHLWVNVSVVYFTCLIWQSYLQIFKNSSLLIAFILCILKPSFHNSVPENSRKMHCKCLLTELFS